MTLTPVFPEAYEPYSVWALTWLDTNGAMVTQLRQAANEQEAIETVVTTTNVQAYGPRGVIDIRRCGPVSTVKPRIVV